MKLSALIALLIIAGCASKSNKISIDSLKTGERIFFGKINIDFNGLDIEDRNCEIFINSEYKPTFTLTADSMISYKTKMDKMHLSQIACWDEKNQLESKWFNYDLPFKAIDAPKSAKKITYFGDINIRWNTKGYKESKQPLQRSMTGSPSNDSYPDQERIHNAGKFRLSIKDNVTKTKKAFLKMNPNAKKGYRVVSNILRKKKK